MSECPVENIGGAHFTNIADVHAGETWAFPASAGKADGSAFDLTGAAVEMRIAASWSSTLLLNGTVTDGASGAFTIHADPADHSVLTEGVYRYQTWCDLADGSKIVAAAGTLTVLPDLRGVIMAPGAGIGSMQIGTTFQVAA